MYAGKQKTTVMPMPQDGGGNRGTPQRERATVLVFVMAILGILFVTGIAFLTSIDQQAEIVQNQLEGDDQQVAVDEIAAFVEEEIVSSFIVGPGNIGDHESLSEFVTPGSANANPGWTLDRVIMAQNSWAQLPGVHGTYAQIEPSNTIAGYAYTSDFDLIRDRDFSAYSTTRDDVAVFLQSLEERVYPVNEFEQERRADYRDGLSVDADGDGVIDSRQYLIRDTDLSSDKYARIAAAVNDPGSPDGKIYLGLRIIPHGGLVNLNDSHPNLLDAVFGYDDEWAPIAFTNAHPDRHGPYVPAIEEPALRRRGGMLPPAELVSSAIQGNPAADTDLQIGGSGDFSTKLFPQNSPYFDGPETAHDGNHQYWPFDLQGLGLQNFQERITPSEGNSYDRRHLVTTVSHDDLLSRGAYIDIATQCAANPTLYRNERMDVLALMASAVRQAQCEEGDPGYDGLAFEYLDYPHTILSARRTEDYPEPSPGSNPEATYSELYVEDGAVSWCECDDQTYGTCTNDLRKGRIALSLPWLDSALAQPIVQGSDILQRTPERPISEEQRNNLIQEAFMMLLLNARSSSNNEWGRFVPTSDDCQFGNGGYAWNRTVTTQTGGPTPDWKHLSRQVAALTANMIDFMDADSVPTRIPVRNFEFTNSLQPVADLGMPYGGADSPEEYMYGLEEQPFFMRIAAALTTDNMGDLDPSNSGYAVEIFNPYPDEFERPLSTTDAARFHVQVGSDPPILIDSQIQANNSVIVYTDPGSVLGNIPGGLRSIDGMFLEFEAGDTIYLLREVSYNNGPSTYIVIDEFEVSPTFVPMTTPDTSTTTFYLHERKGISKTVNPTGISPTGPWYATYPAGPNDAQAVNTAADLELGALFTEPLQYVQQSGIDERDRVPVELLLPNSGTFESAFPTTGTMLMLIRHANRALIAGQSGLAFNTTLLDNQTALDNGRMPIFDTDLQHHWNPSSVPFTGTGGTGPPWQPFRPGESMHLPWGQLLFDYFTALPLENEGPYRADNEANDYRVASNAQPRVDEEGLRVHGRIDLNAAPWFVLRGLPYVPMSAFGSFPQQTQVWLKQSLTPPDNQAGLPSFNDGPRSLNDATTPVSDDAAGVIGEQRAKAIVAYRELRNVEDGTSDYACDTNEASCTDSRGWTADVPTMRRGTGFLAIGELANVRSGNAQRAYRMDNGRVNPTSQVGRTASPFLNAAGPLICLGDWVSVRSHVFTIYGTVRGEFGDSEAEDIFATIEDNAIRFQETVDRLPLFNGAAKPDLIGERVTVGYEDVLND